MLTALFTLVHRAVFYARLQEADIRPPSSRLSRCAAPAASREANRRRTHKDGERV